jgi:hypothetical protein
MPNERVLNRGEAVNALKRAIYVGRVASYRAEQHEEMQAVADALSLLANLVMAAKPTPNCCTESLLRGRRYPTPKRKVTVSTIAQNKRRP